MLLTSDFGGQRTELPGRRDSSNAGRATSQIRQRRPIRNELLAGLPESELNRILPCLERVSLKPRQVLQERNLPGAYAYFIERGAASLLARSGDGTYAEMATLGYKDFVGLPMVLGTGRSPLRCVVQIAGEALRISRQDLTEALAEAPILRNRLLAAVQAIIIQSAQRVVCSQQHSLAQRLARWLLVAHDRIDGDTIPVTHQCLGKVLGVRRAGITTAIGRMERDGLLRRGRGQVGIMDRMGLEHAACSCYRVVQLECERVSPQPA